MVAQLKNVDIGVKLSVPWLIIRARVDLKFQSPVWAEGPYWRLKKFEIGLALMISQGTDNFTPIYTFFSCATMVVVQVTLNQGDSNISQNTKNNSFFDILKPLNNDVEKILIHFHHSRACLEDCPN